VSLDSLAYGPWAVIAGGSEGVGAAFADELSAVGINLVLVARKPGPLEQTAERSRDRGVQVRTVALDLIADGALDVVRAATDDVEVGLFIFNAGANTYGAEIVEGDPDRFQQVIDLNIGAQLRLTQHFGKRLKDRGRGGILLLGSLAGYLGQPRIGVYSAAKAFGRILAESLWIELAPHGVQVLELVLGVTRTPAMERAGLRMDLPGLNVAEPAAVAREGLAHLGGGPLWIAGGNLEAARARNGFGRADLVRAAAEATRRLVPSR
jgi:uncharacterized protein